MISSKAIVLKKNMYRDSGITLDILTPEGKISALVQGLNSKTSKLKRAEFEVGSCLDINMYHAKNTESLHRIKESKFCFLLNQIFKFPKRQMELNFICELVNNSITGIYEDYPTFNFLFSSIEEMEKCYKENFTLRFCFQLCTFLGFKPDQSYSNKKYFDLSEGIFRDELPNHNFYLNKKFSELFFSIEQENKTYSKTETKQIMHILINYYKLHIDNFKTPKSLEFLTLLEN